jgi:ubiquinone biosynthesis protein UbiJ
MTTFAEFKAAFVPMTFDVPVGRLKGRVSHKVTIKSFESLMDNMQHGVKQRVNDGVSAYKTELFASMEEWEKAVVSKTKDNADRITNETIGSRASASAKLAEQAEEIAKLKAMIDSLNKRRA